MVDETIARFGQNVQCQKTRRYKELNSLYLRVLRFFVVNELRRLPQFARIEQRAYLAE